MNKLVASVFCRALSLVECRKCGGNSGKLLSLMSYINMHWYSLLLTPAKHLIPTTRHIITPATITKISWAARFLDWGGFCS